MDLSLSNIKTIGTMKKYTLLFLFLSGAILSIAQDINPNGYNKFFYPNGNLASEGTMRKGKPDGFWKTYYENGQLKSEGRRRKFKLDSVWTFYSSKGDTLERIEYRRDKKNGYAYKYQPANDTLNNIPISIELWLNNVREGQASYYYASGKLKERVNYQEGMRQGEGRLYDEEGEVIALNVYKNNFLVYKERINRRDVRGMRQGVWRQYYANGKVMLESNYKDDKLHGYVKTYNERGKMTQQVRYKMGELVRKKDEQGPQVVKKESFFSNGNVKTSGGFLNKKPVGVHREFNEEGKVVAAKTYTDGGVLKAEGKVLKSGRRSGKWKNLYPDGKVKSQGKYRKGRKQGAWKFYFPNGVVEQHGNYLNGKYDGEWKWYYPSGELWREEEYFDGKREGNFVEYSKEGKVISQGKYVQGEREGVWKLAVGDHSEAGEYVVGLRNGEWKFYFADGTLKFEGRFVDGAPTGKQKHFFPDGKLKEIRQYVAGLETGTWKKFDELGNITFEITYKSGKEIKVDGGDITN